MRILVIDDSRAIRLLMERMLNKLGHEVILANNGAEGLVITKDNIFDLILTDRIMEIMSGEQFIECFRKHENSRGASPTARTPIIIVSGLIKNEDQEKLKKIGVNAFLEKPFRQEQLKAVIKVAVEIS